MSNAPEKVWVVVDRDGDFFRAHSADHAAMRDSRRLNDKTSAGAYAPYAVREYHLAPQWRTGKEQDMSDNNNELDALRAEVEALRAANQHLDDLVTQSRDSIKELSAERDALRALTTPRPMSEAPRDRKVWAWWPSQREWKETFWSAAMREWDTWLFREPGQPTLWLPMPPEPGEPGEPT